MNKIEKVIFTVVAATLFLLCAPCATVSAQSSSSQTPSGSVPLSTESIIKEQRQRSGAAALSGNVPDGAKKSLDSLGIKSADKDSLARFTPANMLKTAAASLKKEASAPVKAVAAVFAILLACALLNTLKSTFGEKSLQGVFDIVSSLCIATVILVPVSQCVSYCAKTINDSSGFMLAFLPVYSSLAAVSGHPASAVATQSLLLVSSEALSRITTTTFVPMVDIYLGFCVIGAVSPGINISGIAGFIKSAVSWALGLCITIYTGILTVQGLIASAADNVTIKAAKFVVDGAVPVIGGAVSDAMNTVISCTGLLKTTVGAYAIVVFILAFLPPVLECLLWLLAADLSLAVADILDIANMSGLLKAVREALKLIIALVLASALAMIISVSVMLLLGMGN
jgi:stage III sporulation protein AE